MKSLFATTALLATSVFASTTGGDEYKIINLESAAFKVDQVTMLPSAKGITTWGPNEGATFTITGTTAKKILAGTVKYQIYQDGVTSFISSGNSPYFTCDNKGCAPDEPVALKWVDPNKTEGKFVLHFQAALPPAQPQGQSDFRLVLWGEDQDHEPYDMSATIEYSFPASRLTSEQQDYKSSAELLQVRCQSKNHCIEMDIPGGMDSAFWKDMSYKYNLKDHPECSYSACSRATYPVLDKKVEMKNYPGVFQITYGTPSSEEEEEEEEEECKCGIGDTCCPLELEQAASLVYHHQGGASLKCTEALKRTCSLCAGRSECWNACEKRNQVYLRDAGCEAHRR